jgi:putative holliday junction resolvase
MWQAMPEPLRGTVLGLDFGRQRIGVAVGEWETGLASPLETLSGKDKARQIDRIGALLQTWQACAMVVGVPYTAQGAPSVLAPQCQRFARQLRTRFDLPVFEVNEAFSSSEAESQLKDAGHRDWKARKSQLDAWAASLILQQFLDEGSTLTLDPKSPASPPPMANAALSPPSLEGGSNP